MLRCISIAIIGIELTSNMYVFDIIDPNSPVVLSLIFNADQNGDLIGERPESLLYIDALDILIAVNKSNGTTTACQLTAVPVPAAVWLFGSALLGLFANSRRKIA